MRKIFTVIALFCALGLAAWTAQAQDKAADKPAAEAPAAATAVASA